MNPQARTGILLAALALPLSIAGGYLGATLAPAPQAPFPVTPAALSAAPAAHDDTDQAEFDALRDRLDARLGQLERAIGDLRFAEHGAAVGPDAPPPARIAVEDVETFLKLEASAARFRALRGRQSRARLGIARIVADASLSDGGRAVVDAAAQRYFDEEQRLLQVDQADLDELGRRRLEQARADLRVRTIDELAQSIDEGVARAVADQLWLGRTSGNVVRGPGELRSIGQGELRAPASMVPGSGGRPVTR